MELYDAMRTTPATREFTGEDLPDEVLHRILDHARFAPSGGNRQGARVVVVRERATRERLVELTEPAVRRYVAQGQAGQTPWTSVEDPIPTPEEIAATDVPPGFTEPLRTAGAVLVVVVDLAALATTDRDLDRIGIVGGASVYPLVWNVLLAARAEGYGGTITTMAVAHEQEVLDLLGVPAGHALAAIVPLGRPVKQVTRLRRQEVAEFVTRETFSGDPLRSGD